MIAFGPVPSRRLGHSLGINNVFSKKCSYSCVYCQVGRTLQMQIERTTFYKPEQILESVTKKIEQAKLKAKPIDYLAFVSNGEPSLDINLGKEIEMLKPLGIKIAVITNASLMWQREVRDDICNADWVSLKIDAISENIWRKINRPHKSLDHKKILQGILEFGHDFKGELTTETMLIKNINDNIAELKKISDFIYKLKPDKAYISIPTRPPAEGWVSSPAEYSINRAYQIFKEKSINLEYLIGYEGNEFVFTGNVEVEEDLLSIMAVHPMKKEAVEEFLKKANTDWDIIEKLINDGKLKKVIYKNCDFYIRKIK